MSCVGFKHRVNFFIFVKYSFVIIPISLIVRQSVESRFVQNKNILTYKPINVVCYVNRNVNELSVFHFVTYRTERLASGISISTPQHNNNFGRIENTASWLWLSSCRHHDSWFTGRRTSAVRWGAALGPGAARGGERLRARRRGGARRGTRDGARCSARSSLARGAYCQSGAGCGDVNCIGAGRDRSVGRDVSCSNVPCACAEPPCVIVCLCCSRWRRLRSSLRGPLRPHRNATDPKIPEMVSAVEAPARGLFTSTLVPALSLYLPPVSLCRVRTRLFLLCFVSEMQTPTSTAPDQVPSRGRVFVPSNGFCMFFVVFSQVAVRRDFYSFIERLVVQECEEHRG